MSLSLKTRFKPAKRSEHDEQVALVRWFDLHNKTYRGRLAAVPNGGQRNKVVAVKLKREGVRAGFPDLLLLVPRGGYSGLIIEMKITKGGTVSEEQKDWLAWLREQGFLAIVCRGFEEARAVILNYLAGEMVRAAQ